MPNFLGEGTELYLQRDQYTVLPFIRPRWRDDTRSAREGDRFGLIKFIDNYLTDLPNNPQFEAVGTNHHRSVSPNGFMDDLAKQIQEQPRFQEAYGAIEVNNPELKRIPYARMWAYEALNAALQGRDYDWEIRVRDVIHASGNGRLLGDMLRQEMSVPIERRS